MKESEMKKGMRVFISDTENTKNTHTVTQIMSEMLNKSFKIQYIKITPHGDAAVINNYCWHPNDLTKNKPIKKEPPKTQYFDVKELVI